MHTPQPASIPQRLFAHLMSFGLCVAMPAAVMLVMPVTTTIFTRGNGEVSATATRKIFFLIPFSNETVTGVAGVDDHYQHGTLTQTTRAGPVNDPKRPETRTEDMSWLVIQGRGASIQVPVSPANIDSVRRRVRDFLADPEQLELRLFTVANWKISVITAGLLCLLTVIYLGSIAWGIAGCFRRKPGSVPA